MNHNESSAQSRRAGLFAGTPWIWIATIIVVLAVVALWAYVALSPADGPGKSLPFTQPTTGR